MVCIIRVQVVTGVAGVGGGRHAGVTRGRAAQGPLPRHVRL